MSVVLGLMSSLFKRTYVVTDSLAVSVYSNITINFSHVTGFENKGCDIPENRLVWRSLSIGSYKKIFLTVTLLFDMVRQIFAARSTRLVRSSTVNKFMDVLSKI